MGETGRLFGTGKGEHKDESDKISQKNFTRAARKESETQEIKSAVVQHVADVNHVIDWEGSGILAKESVKGMRRIRESIWIRRKGGKKYTDNLMNLDEGAYHLSHLYDKLLRDTSSSDDVKSS